MKINRIRKGLDLPISGSVVSNTPVDKSTKNVAVMGTDFVGLRARMEVVEGDVVAQGQVLCEDKKNPGVTLNAPVAGKVVAVERGHKRALVAVVIEQDSNGEKVSESPLDAAGIAALSANDIAERLQSTGLWAALRTRPFNKVPAVDSLEQPLALFVTAIDTRPLAVEPATILQSTEGWAEHFDAGLSVLSQLMGDRPVHVAVSETWSLEPSSEKNIQYHRFAGKHPAGLAGTHINAICPVDASRQVWFVGYQDVVAIGRLFAKGELNHERVIALAGPQIKDPKLVRTTAGADIAELIEGELKEGETRVLSGDVLGGYEARGSLGYLGRFHNQVSALAEGREQKMLGWLTPGPKSHSIFSIYLSKLIPGLKLDLTTTTNGSPRSMVPAGQYEKVMPLDLLPTLLLRALIIGDTDQAIALGALELDEEDLALCTYVCVGKFEYGPILRENLTTIEKEG